MLKALKDALMLKQKAGNDLLLQAKTSNEQQTEQIELEISGNNVKRLGQKEAA